MQETAKDKREREERYHKLVNTWQGRDKASGPRARFTHWTPKGVFEIEYERKLGSHGACILFEQKVVGWQSGEHPSTAAFFLWKGAFDEKLGFKAAEIVPDNLIEWNMLS